MTLQEIIDTIMLKYPHSFDNEEVVKVINRVQNELFRTIYKPHTATQYDLIADNPFYALSYSPKRIIEVIVNGEEYPLVNIRDDSPPCKFYYEDDNNAIGIYPTPTESVSSGLVISRYKDPTPLTSSDLTVEPDLDSAWHMFLVYRVCIDFCEASRDKEMADVFISQYNGLEIEYFRDITYEPTQIQERW